MTSRPAFLIADDHTLVAELCKRLLETELDVVEMVSDDRALLRAAGKLKPDVISHAHLEWLGRGAAG